MRPLTLLAVALVAWPGPVTGQDARLRKRLGAATAEAVQAVVDSAVAEGIPAEALIQKALEGKTLGASPERILAAVRSLRVRLVTSRRVLGPERSADELAAAAAALRVGVDPAILAMLGARLPNGTAGLPLVVLSDLIQRGVPPHGAAEAVSSLADARVDPAGYIQLRLKVEEDIQRGAVPEAAARARARGIVLRQLGGGRW